MSSPLPASPSMAVRRSPVFASPRVLTSPLVGLLAVFAVSVAAAQPAPEADSRPSATEEAGSAVDRSASGDASADSPPSVPDVGLPGRNTAAAETLEPLAIEPVEQKSEGLGVLLSTIDGAFASAVEGLATVLFYSVGKHEVEYVEYVREEPFVRTAGTSDSFRPLRMGDPALERSLSVADLSRLKLEGRLVGGQPTEPLLGRVGEKGVDYVLVAVPHEDPEIASGTRYVRDGDLWRRRTARRGLLSETDVLTTEQVELLAPIWQVAAEPPESGPAWRQREQVGGMPLIVAWLALGALFFTIRMGLVNIWAFPHAVAIVRGKYDNPDEPGEVTHAQALASALSATVGLGNISGVTIAMTLGGPGAFFWMLVCGFLGMASKFVECTLAQKYRAVDSGDGHVLGGPMRYLSAGLATKGLGGAGRTLAVLFAVMCVLASFGGGNMFQAHEATASVVKVMQQGDIDRILTIEEEMFEAAAEEDGDRYTALRDERVELEARVGRLQTTIQAGLGLLMALAVGAVILGGIKRIGATAARIVPAMCGIYLAACLVIIGRHFGDIPTVVGSIFTEAFNGQALGGGLVGAVTVAVLGIKRAAFSNEAGVGSAAIAHSAAKTDEPVREGCVALLGPFLDTLVVCSMTALVILLTGAWDNQQWLQDRGLEGAALTSEAFRSEISWFPYVLAVATVLFAFSSIISWSYYGEMATEYLLGRPAVKIYKLVAVLCVFVGSITTLGAVLDFSDMMILCMAVPNVLGAVLLSGDVRRDMQDYWRRYRAGEFDRTAGADVAVASADAGDSTKAASSPEAGD